MNKQELIDKAVNVLNGKYPPHSSASNLWLNVQSGQYESYSLKYEPHPVWGMICSELEFQQRAKELGWINGYKWGVEYPARRKEPNLPDNIKIQVNTEMVKGWMRGTPDCWDWESSANKVLAFRIIDQRYEPVERPPEAMPVSAEMEAKIARASVNWYDYDKQEAIALPPVGVKVEFKYKIDENWLKCRTCHVICFYGGRAWLYLDGNESSNIYDVSQFEFRPLDHNRKAEEDKKRVVDAALSAGITVDAQSKRDIMERLYDLGFLKLPEGKK